MFTSIHSQNCIIASIQSQLCILMCMSIHSFFGKQNFFQNWKKDRKKRLNPVFRNIFSILKKFCLRPNKKSECLQTQIICTKNFKKFFGEGKNWQQLQNRNFHQLQQIFDMAGWNHPYVCVKSRFGIKAVQNTFIYMHFLFMEAYYTKFRSYEFTLKHRKLRRPRQIPAWAP